MDAKIQQGKKEVKNSSKITEHWAKLVILVGDNQIGG